MPGFRVGIFWKLSLSILASVALSFIIITFLYLELTPTTSLHAHIKNIILQESYRIASWVEAELVGGTRSEAVILGSLHQQDSACVALYGTDGKLIARPSDSAHDIPASIAADSVDEAVQQGFFFEITYPRRVLSPVVLVPIRIRPGRQAIVRCDYPITKKFLRILPPWMIEGVVLVSLLLSVLLISRYLTRPLRQLTRAARQMAQGNFNRMITIRSRDEVGELAQAMSGMSQRIANDNASRRELFADISHELRSPLARILTDAELLLMRPMDRVENEKHLRAICSEIENLNQLIGDLTILAKNENDALEIDPAPNPLSEVVLHSLALFLPQIEEKRIRLIQTIPEGPVFALFDPKRIGQVVSNLVENALRYTPEGGIMEIGISLRGHMAEVWLRDTGAGIPQEKLPYVFDRFFRVDKSRSRTTGGSGLGLAIVKRFVEGHGGQVGIESKLGQGTQISFTVPLPL